MTTISEPALRAGVTLPDITLIDESGAPVRLHNHAGSTLILFFYPKDGSRGCTTQACAMRDSWPLLRSAGLEVFGINPGSVKSHMAFRERLGLPFPLLVDEEAHLARQFGLPVKWSPLGPGRMWVERATVIVDPDMTIRSVTWPIRANAHFDMLKVNLGLPERERPVMREDAEGVVEEGEELADAAPETAEDSAAPAE